MTKASERMSKMRKRRISEGRCARCGQTRNLDGTDYHCRVCADLQATQQRQRRKQPGDAAPFIKPQDPARTAKNVRRMRHRRSLDGLCVDCGVRRGFQGTRTRCRACADTHSEKQKGRREQERDPLGIIALQQRRWEQEMLYGIKDGLTPVVLTNRYSPKLLEN